ncbi:MAG: SRPBCC domain-containing protein [Candidatus Andersenbacteria bacterium]
MKNYTHSLKIKASPEQVYETLMDSAKHTELTGSKAVMSPDVGGEFTAYDGYITGKNVELVKGEKIVQEWRGDETDWPTEQMSKVTYQLKAVDGGTQLDFSQEGIPDTQYDAIAKGWDDFYWQPLTKKFGAL